MQATLSVDQPTAPHRTALVASDETSSQWRTYPLRPSSPQKNKTLPCTATMQSNGAELIKEAPPSPSSLANCLQAHALSAAQQATQQLGALEEAYRSMHTRLATELATLRTSVRIELNAAATAQKANVQRLERAARALAVRAMQLDNRALELDIRERAVVDAQKRHHNLVTQRERDFGRRRVEIDRKEREVLAKEASLKYSTLQQAQLHQWSKRLEKRENEAREAQAAESERIATRLASIVKREMLTTEKERRFESACQRREDELQRREAAAELLADALQKQRRDAQDQIQRERSQFWKHQQKLSAVVSREIEALLVEQAKLRAQFEQDAAAANTTLRSMANAVADFKSSVRETPEDRQTPKPTTDSDRNHSPSDKDHIEHAVDSRAQPSTQPSPEAQDARDASSTGNS